MAWTEVHQTLPTHKKTKVLRRLLKIKTPAAVGHLCMLWLWCLDNAPDGDLSRINPEDIAEAVGWEKRPDQLMAALTEAGFLTEETHVHDWYDYAGKLIERRRQNAARMRRARADTRSAPEDDPAAVHNTCAAGAALPYPTAPDHTLQRPEDEVINDRLARRMEDANFRDWIQNVESLCVRVDGGGFLWPYIREQVGHATDDMISCAVEFAAKRRETGELKNPAAYVRALLGDWRVRGCGTREQIYGYCGDE